MSTVYSTSALQALSNLQLRGLLCKARYDLNCSTPGSFERRDALINLENIRRVLAHRLMCPRRPGAHQAMRENAADVLQIDQRVAALERARRAATQVVPGLAEQASQLEVAEGLKC